MKVPRTAIAASPDGKVSKASVNYSLGGDHCGACTHFIESSEQAETGTCTIVAGIIREVYWCKRFQRKPAAK